MYDYIKGQVTRVTPEYVVLEVAGIGYQLLTPNPFAFRKSEEIIQVYTHLHVREAIEREDETFLVKFPGVGKKTARQMILDLKGKLHDLMDLEQIEFIDDEPTLFVDSSSDHELEEAMLALTALGYSERELSKVRPKLKDDKGLQTTDEFMKKALQLLFSGK